MTWKIEIKNVKIYLNSLIFVLLFPKLLIVPFDSKLQMFTFWVKSIISSYFRMRNIEFGTLRPHRILFTCRVWVIKDYTDTLRYGVSNFEDIYSELKYACWRHLALSKLINNIFLTWFFFEILMKNGKKPFSKFHTFSSKSS